jgi:hypothetical protein
MSIPNHQFFSNTYHLNEQEKLFPLCVHTSNLEANEAIEQDYDMFMLKNQLLCEWAGG